MKKGIFLTANWQYLAMINYEVDPKILVPQLPPGTQLDLWQGKALVSMVGFLFKDTRIFGVKWPYFTNFEEVNLRYYVRYGQGDTAKRGVGFVSEIVPQSLIAIIANTLYNEHYKAMPMRHSIIQDQHTIKAKYEWKSGNKWNSLSVAAIPEPQNMEPDSEEFFILQHYWGYNALNSNTLIEYGVEHPAWQVYPVQSFSLDADIAGLYGPEFAPFIQGAKPHSVFMAVGSDVIIRNPSKIKIG